MKEVYWILLIMGILLFFLSLYFPLISLLSFLFVILVIAIIIRKIYRERLIKELNKEEIIKEMKCPNCGLVKPEVVPNVIGYGYLPLRFPFVGSGKVDFERKGAKYLLKCPKCGFILGAFY